VLVATVGVLLDLWTKHLAFAKLTPDDNGYEFIPRWVRFQITTNHGAVFGIGQGQRWLFLAVSAAAVLFLFYLFLSSKPAQWFYQVVLGMLLAGVLGNVYDRINYGYVRDMIHVFPGWPNPLRGIFPDWQYVFPWIFNVADSLLCVGVACMLAYSFFAAGKPGDKQRTPEVRAQRA